MAERSVLIIQNSPLEEPGILGRVLKRSGIESRVVDLKGNDPFPRLENFGAVVVLGGPASANDPTPKMEVEFWTARRCLDDGIPYLGICLGMQILVKAAGGEVVKSPTREIGFIGPDGKPFTVSLTEEGQKDPLFAGLGKKELPAFQLHGETVVPTADVQLLATGQFVPNQIVKVGENAYGSQPHFEFTRQLYRRLFRENPDLDALKLDTEELNRQLAQIRLQVAKTAWPLFSNFLRVAQLI